MKVELEAVDHQEKLPLRVFAHSIRRSTLHAHPEIEILLVLKGNISVRIEGKSLFLGHGDLVLVNGNAPHLSQDEGDENLILAVQIDLSFAQKYDPEIQRRNFAFNEAYAAHRDDPAFEKVREICARLFWETRLRGAGYLLAAESLALELLSLLLRDFKSTLVPRSPEEGEGSMDATLFFARINRIVAFVERHYRERLSLAEIARKEGVNMTYLSRFFKNKMGYSFTEFTQFIRLKKSLSTLEESDRKIVDIALDCGFPNVKSYNMVFKRAYGKTPSQWRVERQHRPANEAEGEAAESAYGIHDEESALSLVRRYMRA